MSERTSEATTTVDEDGIRVEKSFTDDAFPVPAVMYELSSTREEPVRLRIVDRIPESFPMDRIGFHPEYESENWTAYKDHRVEFERVLDPGTTIETVFGIRDENPDLDGFLGAPVIEHVPVGEEIEDVLGTDTDAVREVLSGDRETLPGMEESVAPGVDGDAGRDTDSADAVGDTVADSVVGDERSGGVDDGTDPTDDSASDEHPTPRTVGDDGTAAVTPHDETETVEPEPSDPETVEPEPSDSETSEPEPSDSETTESEAEDTVDDDSVPAAAGADEQTDAGGDPAQEFGLAAALASEIRSGEVDEADLETLRSELGLGVPKSVDVRIARLQSSVADMEAYADALAEFIDEEGTAKEVLDDLDAKIDAVGDETSALEDRLDAAATERTDLRESISEVEESVESVATDVDGVTDRVDGASERIDGVETDVSAVEERVSGVEETVESVTDDIGRVDEKTTAIEHSVEDLDDDVETLYEQVDDTAAEIEAAEKRVDDVESRMGRFDEEFDDLWDDLAEVDTRLTDIEDRLGEDLDDVESEINDINDHLEELEAFRKRLNEAFGP